uniref:Uncharacterized protein n=1 Tax=Phasianus colchicus TaxID=9054 RepID=A0A669QQB8_PHACC
PNGASANHRAAGVRLRGLPEPHGPLIPPLQVGLRPTLRWFRAAPPALAADKPALLKLRKSTGLPFVKCQEALRQCEGDV